MDKFASACGYSKTLGHRKVNLTWMLGFPAGFFLFREKPAFLYRVVPQFKATMAME
jgi:hypothetical protein